jgi:hypothetical protein
MDEQEMNKIFDCLANNDPEGVMDAIRNQFQINDFKRTDLAISTLYHAFREKNPTLRTLAKLVNYCKTKGL